MKALIGILILLFILTAISFSGTAFAGECDYLFAFNGREYQQVSYEEYQSEQAEFVSENSARFSEDLPDRRNYDEFSEFDHSDSQAHSWDNDAQF